jgi:hypothetical protein
MVNVEPSDDVCAKCQHYVGSPRGVGDVVHSLIEKTGAGAVVRAVAGDCGGCAARRAALNAALPFTDEARKDG